MAKVLLICLDIVGKSMAGPAIRYFEFAKALSGKHEVVLMTPNVPDILAENFRFAPFSDMKDEIKRADVVLCQQLKIKMAFWLARFRPRLIIDAYDPQPLEHLEIFKAHPLASRIKKNDLIVSWTTFSMKFADGVLCANDPQRDLWLGLLMALKTLHPTLYDSDPSLCRTLAKVPFGLPDKPLSKLKGMREKFGLSSKDYVLLWGGGIWNWFDPLTLIRALTFLPDVKLVFMGVKHPNKAIPEMKMAQDALELAKELGLLDKRVFFNFGWTPYEERQAFLHEADMGVSTHFNHLETRYAFRTRILDYLWAGLPIVTTQGDSFSELISTSGAGLSVPFENPQALAAAVTKIRENPDPFREKSRQLAQAFVWPQVTKPLDEMIDYLAPRKAKGIPVASVLAMAAKVLKCR